MSDKETNTIEHPFPDLDGYFELLNLNNYSIEEADKIVRTYNYDEYEWLYQTHMYYILDIKTRDYVRYSNEDLDYLNNDKDINIIYEYADKYEIIYYKALRAFFVRDNKKCIEYIKDYFGIPKVSFSKAPIDELEIGEDFLQIFKNGYPGFWDDLAYILSEYNCVDYMPQLLNAIGLFYESSDSEEIRTALIDVGRSIPDGLIVNELLAISYDEDKMWRNALSYYKSISYLITMYPATQCFEIAFISHKINDCEDSIEWYRECLSLNPCYTYARNNLAYVLYKTKQYEESKQIIEDALDDENCHPSEISYLSKNYVRVLIALRQYEEADKFIKETKIKIPKELVTKVDRYLNGKENADEQPPNSDKLTDDEKSQKYENQKTYGAKKAQFSSEKILEDELEHRINSGIETFGLKLKVYDHEGDKYGRQYVIPIGRLDLLCEDDNGDLYIIELKKDSGYDDPYKQTVDYIEWFEKHFVNKGQKVTGIICLNNPSKALVKKVKADKRVRLFEYNIAYDEIK